jgi:hypothetical protein
MKDKVAKFFKWKGWFWFVVVTFLLAVWQAYAWVVYGLMLNRFNEAGLPVFLWAIAATILASELHLWRPAKKTIN